MSKTFHIRTFNCNFSQGSEVYPQYDTQNIMSWEFDYDASVSLFFLSENFISQFVNQEKPIDNNYFYNLFAFADINGVGQIPTPAGTDYWSWNLINQGYLASILGCNNNGFKSSSLRVLCDAGFATGFQNVVWSSLGWTINNPTTFKTEICTSIIASIAAQSEVWGKDDGHINVLIFKISIDSNPLTFILYYQGRDPNADETITI